MCWLGIPLAGKRLPRICGGGSYAVELVAEVGIVGKNDEDIEVDDEKLMRALACAGMMRSGISTYEIKAVKSKKFFYLTFRRMW